MYVELGAMLSLAAANDVLEALKLDEGTVCAFLELGRSNDLFDDKQFGEYGESGCVTAIVDEKFEDETFAKIYAAANLSAENVGVIFKGAKILKISTD